MFCITLRTNGECHRGKSISDAVNRNSLTPHSRIPPCAQHRGVPSVRRLCHSISNKITVRMMGCTTGADAGEELRDISLADGLQDFKPDGYLAQGLQFTRKSAHSETR